MATSSEPAKSFWDSLCAEPTIPPSSKRSSTSGRNPRRKLYREQVCQPELNGVQETRLSSDPPADVSSLFFRARIQDRDRAISSSHQERYRRRGFAKSSRTKSFIERQDFRRGARQAPAATPQSQASMLVFAAVCRNQVSEVNVSKVAGSLSLGTSAARAYREAGSA